MEQQKEHFAVIGTVATLWAALELTLDFCALDLLAIPHKMGLCFTAQVIGPGRKLDAYFAAARQAGFTGPFGDLEAFGKQLTSVAERRNRTVHDPLMFDEVTGQPHRFEVTAKRVLRAVVIPSSTESAIKLVADIIKLTDKLYSIHEPIMASTAASRKASQGKPP